MRAKERPVRAETRNGAHDRDEPGGFDTDHTADRRAQKAGSPGIFALWQPIYAEHGLATFPVRILPNGKKKPAVKGYQTLSVKESRSLTLKAKFASFDTFGFPLGAGNGLTLLDVDTHEERVLAEAMERHGPSPIIVRSGGGNWQAWYRHNGERRLIRPWPDRPIDLLGAGYVIAPPSSGIRGLYQFVRGSLDDLGNLPTLQNLDLPAEEPPARHDAPIPKGKRNNALFTACLRQAPQCSSMDELLAFARAYNRENMRPPLDEDEVLATVRSAWKYEQEPGRNWSKSPSVVVSHTDVDELTADELLLLIYVLRWHAARKEFGLPNSLAAKINWGRSRLRRARAGLIRKERIKCVRPWSRTKEAIYSLGGGGGGSETTISITNTLPSSSFSSDSRVSHPRARLERSRDAERYRAVKGGDLVPAIKSPPPSNENRPSVFNSARRNNSAHPIKSAAPQASSIKSPDQPSPDQPAIKSAAHPLAGMPRLTGEREPQCPGCLDRCPLMADGRCVVCTEIKSGLRPSWRDAGRGKDHP